MHWHLAILCTRLDCSNDRDHHAPVTNKSTGNDCFPEMERPMSHNASTSSAKWFDASFLLVVVVPVTIFLITLQLLASKVDELSVNREQNQMVNSLHDTVAEIAANVTSITTWDDAIANIDNHYNQAWADSNIGHYFCSAQGFNWVFILDRDDRPVYAMHDNQDVDISTFTPYGTASQPLIASVRAQEAQRGTIFKPKFKGGVISQPIQAIDTFKVGDELQIVNFTLIQPDFGFALPAKPRSYIVVTARTFDARFLGHFSDRLVLKNLRIAPTGVDADAKIVLTNQSGMQLAQLNWDPYRPAVQLIRIVIIPILLAIGAPLALYFYSRRTSQLLKQMEIMKSQFISSVSHELRTPVTSIRGSLGLLESGVLGKLPDKAHDMVVVAHRNSLRLLKLVNDILDMDKLLSGTIQFRTDQIDIVNLVRQSIEANANYGQEFQVSYRLDACKEGLRAIGDEDRIMQVLANILSNAAKFSRPGSSVDVRICELDSAIKIEIEDTGQGIPLEFQSQIFNPFAQASNGNTRRQGGTGLGLNISKKLVEHMQGEIGYASTPGVGTVFWFTLPKGRQAA